MRFELLKLWLRCTLHLLVVQVALGKDVDDEGAPASADRCICLSEFIPEMFSATMSIFLEDKIDKLLVVEQRGIVMKYDTHGTSLGVFMDLQDKVLVTDDYGDSRGLLSIATHPHYKDNGRVFVYYIREDHNVSYAYLSEFKAKKDEVDLHTEKYMLRIQQDYPHGNGGPMLFGEDGYLYVFTGDGGKEDDLDGHAQNKSSFHGSVLRIDVDNGQSFTAGLSGWAKVYNIPESNPFIAEPDALPELFAYGIRNMWGCSQDKTSFKHGSGRIFCAETGTGMYDEINIIEKGKNYGWNIKEGTECFNSLVNGCNDRLENEGIPIYEFPHLNATALVGGFIYKGDTFHWMNSSHFYIFGNILQGKFYYLYDNGTTWTAHDLPLCPTTRCPSSARHPGLSFILSFAQDLNGELYAVMSDHMHALQPLSKMYKFVAPLRSSSSRTYVHLHYSVLFLVAIAIYLYPR